MQCINEIRDENFYKLRLETGNKGFDSWKEMHLKWSLYKIVCREYIKLSASELRNFTRI